jgi:HEAT repeat protein
MRSSLEKQARRAIANLDSSSRKEAQEEFEKLQEHGVVNTIKLGGFVASSDAAPRARVFGAWLLGHLGSEQAERQLMTDLDDNDSELRCEAALALGRLARPTSIERLFRALKGDSDADVRACCASALGWFEALDVEAALRAAVDDGAQPPKVRAHAAEALANFTTEEVTKTLIGALTATEAELRYWAAFALGQIGAEEALPHLRQVCARDEGELPSGDRVSEEAADAIREIERRKRT